MGVMMGLWAKLRASALAMASLTIAGVAGARAGEPPPISAYMADPAMSNLSLAPDGHALAFLRHAQGEAVINLLPAGSGDPQQISAKGFELRQIEWADNEHLILYGSTVVDSDILPRQRVIQLSAYKIKTKKLVTLLDKAQDVLPMLAGGPVFYGIYKEEPSAYFRTLAKGLVFSLYAADLDTGGGAVLNHGSFDSQEWAVTPDGKILANKVFNTPNSLYSLNLINGGKVVFPDPKVNFSLMGLGRSPETVAVVQNGDLLEVAPSGVVSAPLQPPGVSVGRVFYSPTSGLLQAANTSAADGAPVIFDPRLKAMWPLVLAAFPHKQVLLRGLDDLANDIVVETTGDDDSGSLFWVDLRTGQAQPVGPLRPGIPHDQVAKITKFSFKNRGGITQNGYIILPPGRDPRDLPALAWIGGADSPAFDPMSQLIASRGFAVVAVDHGGADFSDRAPQKPVEGQLGAGVQSDLPDAVAHLAQQGVVNPRRVCIGGLGGFGGYAALEGITRPESGYRCAIGINAVSDLKSMIRYPKDCIRGPMWDDVRIWRTVIGEARLDGRSLDAMSPVNHAMAAAGPSLLIYEKKGDAMGMDQSVRMQAALAHAGRPVVAVPLDIAREGLDSAAGREKAMAAVLDFLKAND